MKSSEVFRIQTGKLPTREDPAFLPACVHVKIEWGRRLLS